MERGGKMTALISWLLEESDPGVRYLALRDLDAAEANPRTLAEARHLAHLEGKIPTILAKMNPEGFWVKPGAGYSPKYQSSVWALIVLAQLGARNEEDERIVTAMNYYRQHAFGRFGKISCNDNRVDTFDCLQGNMVNALLQLGMAQEDLSEQIDWLAISQTGISIAPVSDKSNEKRYVVGKSGPCFNCTHHKNQPCAWGAIRVLLALGQVPIAERTDNVRQAINLGVDFLLQVDPQHPKWSGDGLISPCWQQWMFPLFYQSDGLHLAEALAAVGAINDPRAQPFRNYILSKRNPSGSWDLEFSTPNLAGSFDPIGKPNKWVTLRVLRVLQAAGWED
jgi:hypothetical protein